MTLWANSLDTGLGLTPYYFFKNIIPKRSLEMPNRSPRIVCIRVQWNHSELAGRAPRVGSDCGRFEVLGGGSESA